MGPGTTTRTFRIWVAVACTVGLGVRLTYALVVKAGAALVGDAFFYHWQAVLLLHGKWFYGPFNFFYHYPAIELPSAQHPPLFPVTLTLGDAFGLGSVREQLVLVCLMGTVTIALVAWVAKEIAGPRAGSVSAVVAALYPGLWIYDGEVMSEAELMVLVALTLLVAYRFWREPTLGRAGVLGLCCALCALTRSEMVLLLPLLLVPLVAGRRHLAAALRWRMAGIGLLAAAAAFTPWVARNMVTFDHPELLSSQLPVTLAAANNDATYHGALLGSWCLPCVAGDKEPVADESVQGKFWDHVALTYVEHHLSRVPVVEAARVGLVWNLFEPVRQTVQNQVEAWPRPVSTAWLVEYYPLMALAACGFLSLRRRKVPAYPLAVMFAIVTVAVLVTYANARFRAEAEVATVILAAVGVDALWERQVSGRRGPAVAAGEGEMGAAVAAGERAVDGGGSGR